MSEAERRAREAFARCLADVEDHPEPEHYSLADDLLLALDNAGLQVVITDMTDFF